MTTKCIKLAVEYCNDNIIDKKIFFKELRDIQYKTYLACNRAMTYMYTNDMQNFIQKDIGVPKQDDKDVYGKSFGAWIENRMNEIMDGCLSNNVAQTRAYISNRYKNDKKSGLLKGNVSLSQVKRNNPIIVHNVAYKVIETTKGLGIQVSLFNLPKQEELGLKRGQGVTFIFPKIDDGSKATLINIINKSYKQGTLQLSYNERKKKWLATLSYTFESRQEEGLNDNLVMGIDLGITKVATMSVFDTVKEEWVRMNWKEQSIDGKELIHYRQKIEARRRELSIATKWASDSKIGHGRKKRMETVNKIGDKYTRFKDTYNHKISRYIIDLAIKYNTKTIQMENLSGFSEYQTESLLKNWSYYDLQAKIKYKAEEKGIEVILINPKYTSKRCSRCGCIHEDNRNCKENQGKFECKVCGHNENADINASKNISIPYIDSIISETEVIKTSKAS